MWVSQNGGKGAGTSIILHVTQSEYFAYRLHVRRSNEKVNSINASGIPLSELNLKVGCPIMILCNLDPANGLCVVGGRMWQWGVG